MADAVVALNQEIEATARKLGSTAVYRIPNGIAAECFTPPTQPHRHQARSQLGIGHDEVIFLYCGRITPQKNLDLLLDAWRTFATQPGGPGARLWLLGAPDNPAYYAHVARVVAGAPSVDLLEPTPHPLPFYQAGDVFVLPSLREGLSNSLLEALSCGMMAVVSDIPGNRAVVDQLDSTWLCPPLSAEALVSAFSAASSLALHRRDGTRRQQHQVILERFGIAAVAGRYAALYEKLTGLVSPPARVASPPG
jgi:glycosyltransferase involved in cell wall biosynthesis